jgi:aminopeptidase N
VGDLARAGEWNRYTISAEIDPDARTLIGRMRLEYTNRDGVALDRLYFHLYPNLPDFGGRLEVRQVQADGAGAEVVYEARRYLLRVNLPQPLAPGARTTIVIAWSTSAPENASQRLYGAFNKEAGVLALASAYPIVAVVRGGQWDIGRPDPQGDFVNSETALYDVTLRAPGDWLVLTTGRVIDRSDQAGTAVLRIVSGPQRDFMIALTQLEVATAEVAGTQINSYYRADDRGAGQSALQAAANALSAFNKRYGPYPLRELDVVEIAAGTFLGVEYPGLIAIEQSLYASGDGLEITVAHEVGHQWWYSQVGNDVQTSSWLDEALASYSQIVYQEEIYGPAAAAQELEGFRQRYRRVLAQGLDAPAQQPNSAFRGNYVTLVYGKAVLFFQAMRAQIGDAAFDRFLHDYYASQRYNYVNGDTLRATAEASCACDLRQLYDDWITRAVPLEVP